MIKHIVMWRLKDSALGNKKAGNARLVREKLEALRGRIPGLLRLEVGLDFSATENSAVGAMPCKLNVVLVVVVLVPPPVVTANAAK